MIKNIYTKLSLAGSALLMPLVSLAQFQKGDGKLEDFGIDIIQFINGILVPFVFAVALLLFIYGLFLYFFYEGGESDSRKNGRNYMIWAVIAFVVMVAVWGLVNLIAGGLGFSKVETISPLIPVAGDSRP